MGNISLLKVVGNTCVWHVYVYCVYLYIFIYNIYIFTATEVEIHAKVNLQLVCTHISIYIIYIVGLYITVSS